MLSFLDLLGTIGGSILGLPGILGLALGMMTRNILVAMVMGGLVGVLAPVVFGGIRPDNVAITEFAVAVIVGIAAGAIGCAIRRKGATV